MKTISLFISQISFLSLIIIYSHALGSDDHDHEEMAGNSVCLIEDGGMAELVGENIHHPNGNIFDQILLTGLSATVQAKEGQITRVSFMDENEDIVQAEFSGSGTLSITLDPTTYKPAALPARYNQDVKYVTGKPSIVINGADETTYCSIFTVGTLNAVNQALFPEGQEYDAKADVKLVEVNNSTEIGGMLMANAEFSGKSGKVGVDARNVKVKQRVTFGDIDASDDAVPYLLFDENAFDNDEAGPGPMVAGGDLVQTNGAAIVVRSPGQVNPSFTGLPTLANYKSDDTHLKKVRPDELVKAKFKIEDGEDITPKECNCAQGGGLMFDDRYDAEDNPFPLDDGIKDFKYDGINYDSETGYYGKISRDDYEYSGEGDVDKSVAMKVIAVPADHDGVDNDGDGEIDEEDEMELIVFTRDKAKGGSEGSSFINTDGEGIERSDHDGIDNDGDGEIDEADERVQRITAGVESGEGFIVLSASNDGIDNDVDGEIDEEDEYRVVYNTGDEDKTGDEDYNDANMHYMYDYFTDGSRKIKIQYISITPLASGAAFGNRVSIWISGPTVSPIEPDLPGIEEEPEDPDRIDVGEAWRDGLDNDGDGEIDEPGESYPPDPFIDDTDDEESYPGIEGAHDELYPTTDVGIDEIPGNGIDDDGDGLIDEDDDTDDDDTDDDTTDATDD